MQAADLAQSFPESIAESRLKSAPPTFRGHSPAARRVQSMIHRAVRTNLPVLLVGAKGSGKETIARILHHFGGGEVPNVEVVNAKEQGRLVSLGIKGFWNFSHYDLSVSYPEVVVENVHLGDSLMSLGYRLRNQD